MQCFVFPTTCCCILSVGRIEYYPPPLCCLRQSMELCGLYSERLAQDQHSRPWSTQPPLLGKTLFRSLFLLLLRCENCSLLPPRLAPPCPTLIHKRYTLFLTSFSMDERVSGKHHTPLPLYAPLVKILSRFTKATSLQVQLLRTVNNTSQDVVMQAPENSGRGVAMAAAALRSVDDTSKTQVKLGRYRRGLNFAFADTSHPSSSRRIIFSLELPPCSPPLRRRLLACPASGVGHVRHIKRGQEVHSGVALHGRLLHRPQRRKLVIPDR